MRQWKRLNLTVLEARALEVLLLSVLNEYRGPLQIRRHYERILEQLRQI